MAKIRKSKLSWQPAESAQVTGYRLYWSAGRKLSYDSGFVELGKVSEVDLADVLKAVPYIQQPLLLGIAAVDINGNESDIAALARPYQLAAPPAPVGFSIKFLDEYEVIETADNDASNQFDKLFEEDTRKGDSDESTSKGEPLSEG